MAPFFAASNYESAHECSSVSSDDLEEMKTNARAQYGVRSFEKQYRRLRTIVAMLIVVLVLSNYYVWFVHEHSSINTLSLGADPFGYVPTEVEELPKWTIFDENDPYYIEYDVFDSVENTERVFKKLDYTEHSNIMLADGKKASYLGSDGVVRELRTAVHEGSPVYSTRAFHQMHCIMSITDEYGHLLHGQPTNWTAGHVAHCMNILREAVACLADSSVVSYTYLGDRHVGHDQQSRCRNYMALRNWANDPAHDPFGIVKER